jgi:ATP-dependent Clp protease protease subunit
MEELFMGVPYVIEGSESNERVYDLFSRLLKDRIIFIGKEFTEDLANSVVAQLLFLESDNPEKDIIIYINSPGGYVSAQTAIFDTMNYVKPDVSTICVGHASSAAAVTLAAGTKGKRCALKNARIMLHQVSSGVVGHIEDMRIRMGEADFLNERMIEELAKITKKSVKRIKQDLNRDYFMSAEEAKKYGIIDEVLATRD